MVRLIGILVVALVPAVAQTGDIESRRGRTAEAVQAWGAAFENAPDRGARKRLRKKLEGR